MARLRQNFMEGAITNNPLAIGGTNLTSATLASLVAVVAPDVLAITLDPAAVHGSPEIVHVTAHTALATSATILRAQEGTAARAHPLGTVWEHNITEDDFDYDNLAGLPTLGLAGEDEGVAQGQFTTLDVVGAGAALAVAGGAGTLTIPGGGADFYMARATLTSGNKTLNSTSLADVDVTTDLVLTAATGDWVEVALCGLWGNSAVTGTLDVVSIVAAAVVNSWAYDGAPDATGSQALCWYGPASVLMPIGGTLGRFLLAGDISGGTVTLRVRYRTQTAANKTLFATTADPFSFIAKNLGPTGP